jgi:hypothetical protein
LEDVGFREVFFFFHGGWGWLRGRGSRCGFGSCWGGGADVRFVVV